MLSSIGRASVRRVVSRGPQSTNRALQSTWQFQRADNNQNTNNASTRSQFPFSAQRSYATATKVASKPKASKTTPTKTSTKKVTKKPVKKPAKKKVVAKKPVKRVQSKTSLARIEAAKRRTNIDALKAVALTDSPKTKPSTTWRVVLAEAVKPGMKASSLARDAASKYKSLSPAELESYNHIAAQNAAENKAMHKKWVESYTPDQIRLANNARRALRLLAKDHKRVKSLPAIEDERQPKGRASARAIYCGDRWASGDFKGISLSDASKLLAKEWDALPSSDRQAYQEREIADKQRYVKEFRAAFKRDPEYAAPVKE
ncbi:hypothetical protein BKA65DRAFT_554265 [Rhexocercosporidium sp. MPI-PUGE-AT-0058]|nr:hypothetical protein BKA65DRAFT_554265 [Rhexocercosporidium sp. MPI-PUGE-AT-0058]